MNKQQLYTFGGALLASTALSGAANALTWGKVSNSLIFTTTAINIANTLFSTTASTANSVVISADGTATSASRIAARFANNYSAATVPGTQFSVEMSPTGATLGNGALTSAAFLIVGSHGTTYHATLSAASICANAVGFGTQFVLNGCTAAAGTAGAGQNRSMTIGGVLFSGITFSNASGLATIGSSIQMTGRVYNTSTSGNFEANATGNVITSANPTTVAVLTRANVTASAVTTPLAFTSLASSNVNGGLGTSATLTMELVTLALTGTGAFRSDLSTVSTPGLEHSSIRATITSGLLSSSSVAAVTMSGGATPAANLTAANFSGGTVTFDVSQSNAVSFTVQVVFNGTTAIPSAAAGTATFAFNVENGNGQSLPSISGATAATNQGGFRAEVNTFNSSANGPYSSYLRVHNNGGVAGAVTITVRNDDHTSGATLGSAFTTAAIQPNGTMQLSAAEIEGTATSTKLPAGGANIPTASRTGSYTISATGPIVGYVQHILFDGTNVADLSAFRNSGQTSNNAAP